MTPVEAGPVGNNSRSTKRQRTSSPVRSIKAMKASKYEPEEILPNSVILAGTDFVRKLNRFVFKRLQEPEAVLDCGVHRIGTLVSGPPGTGTGSTLLLVSSERGVPVISLGHHLEEASSSSPEKVSKIFTDILDEAKRIAPCVLLLENLDAFMPKSNSSHGEFNYTVFLHLKRNMRLLLRRWMEDGKRVVIVATTSKPELIDPSLLESEYFSKTITVKVPNMDDRETIFRSLTRNINTAEIDFKTLAVSTHGFVGSDIRTVVQIVCDKAEAESSAPPTCPKATQQDFLDAIAEHTPILRREGFSPIPSTTWSEVGALHSVRSALELSIVRRIKEPDLFKKFGPQRPAGVLLFGPPGCGKTLVAKAVANAAQASFILIKGPELLNKYVGESERAIRELFYRAKSCAPCIIFFDEMDSLVPNRENTTTEAGARVVNALLAELDGATDRGEVYIIGTSNRPDMIDPAMLRPGRLDKLLFVDLPTRDERVEILRTIIHNAEDSLEVRDIKGIAEDTRCDGFSGADLYGLYKNAQDVCLSRHKGGEVVLTRQDWEEALNKTKPSVENPETYRNLAATLHHQW